MPSELHLQRTWTGTHGAEKAESRRPRQAPCPLGGPRHWAWVCSTRPSTSQSQRWDVPAHPDPVRSQAVTPRREAQCGAARGFPGTPPVSMGVCKPVAQPREAVSTSTPRRPFGAHEAQGRRLAQLPKVPTRARSQRQQPAPQAGRPRPRRVPRTPRRWGRMPWTPLETPALPGRTCGPGVKVACTEHLPMSRVPARVGCPGLGTRGVSERASACPRAAGGRRGRRRPRAPCDAGGSEGSAARPGLPSPGLCPAPCRQEAAGDGRASAGTWAGRAEAGGGDAGEGPRLPRLLTRVGTTRTHLWGGSSEPPGLPGGTRPASDGRLHATGNNKRARRARTRRRRRRRTHIRGRTRTRRHTRTH